MSGSGTFSPARTLAVCLVLFVVLVVALAAGLSVGAAPVRPWTLLSGALSGDEAMRAREILLGLRLPRLLLAAIVGAALSAGGVAYQAVLRNPLADPFILGVSGGAALGAILSSALGLEAGAGEGALGLARPVLAFAGAVAAILALFAVSRGSRRRLSETSVLLTGAIINAFLSAVILFVITVADYTRFQRVFFWLVGSIEPPPLAPLATTGLLVAAGLAALVLLSGRMNVLSLGDDEARALGIDPHAVRRNTILAASLVTAAAVSMSGLIGFVGLMVPHAARTILGPDHRSLLPASALAGAAFLVAADSVARSLLAPVEMPVGIITALCGGPFFLYLFNRRGGLFTASGGR